MINLKLFVTRAQSWGNSWFSAKKGQQLLPLKAAGVKSPYKGPEFSRMCCGVSLDIPAISSREAGSQYSESSTRSSTSCLIWAIPPSKSLKACRPLSSFGNLFCYIIARVYSLPHLRTAGI